MGRPLGLRLQPRARRPVDGDHALVPRAPDRRVRRRPRLLRADGRGRRRRRPRRCRASAGSAAGPADGGGGWTAARASIYRRSSSRQRTFGDAGGRARARRQPAVLRQLEDALRAARARLAPRRRARARRRPRLVPKGAGGAHARARRSLPPRRPRRAGGADARPHRPAAEALCAAPRRPPLESGGSPLVAYVQAHGPWSWGGTPPLTFAPGGELRTPWGAGRWGPTEADDILYADFVGMKHQLDLRRRPVLGAWIGSKVVRLGEFRVAIGALRITMPALVSAGWRWCADAAEQEHGGHVVARVHEGTDVEARAAAALVEGPDRRVHRLEILAVVGVAVSSRARSSRSCWRGPRPRHRRSYSAGRAVAA